MRGFVNKYTITWYWVSKSQPCREQSTIAGLIAVWCGHVTRDTCVWCVTLRRRARQCWGRRSVYGSYKNWRWRSGDGISKSDWGYHSVQAQHGPSRHAGLVWWYCTQRRPLLSKKLLWMGVKTSHLMLSLHKQEALRNLATKPPLSASIVQHCQILSNISCMPGQNKI